MTSKHNDDRLEQAYREMVNGIRELISKEGKSLTEATNLTEEKLKSWQKLTSEELQKVSKEVRQDLKSLGSTLQESKEAFRQQWQDDSSYAKDKLVDSLSYILQKANAGIDALNELLEPESKKTAEDKAQPEKDETTLLTKAPSHELSANEPQVLENEHHEHQQWHSERVFWQDEIAIWKKEHQLAQEIMDELREGFVKLDEKIEDHSRALRFHELVEEDHEAMLAEAQHDDVIHHDIHEDERRSHEEQRQIHQQIKSQQQEIMILLEKLQKSVRSLN